MTDARKLIKISRILLYLTALTPFVLAARFIFPYVVVRTNIFRALIEVILILFLYLLIAGKIKTANLKKNYFFWIFAGLLIIEFIAALFGESFITSFFGDLERSWGIFTVLHLFIFYFLLRSFFTAEEWKIFFNVSFGVSLLVSVYGIVQRFPNFFDIYLFEAGANRITSTLGNPAYVSIYLLFHIGFALYFLLKNRHRPLKYFYLAVIIINFFAFLLTEIRGAYLGMIVGSGVSLAAYVFLSDNKKCRTGAAALIIGAALVLLFSFWRPDSALVRNTPLLRRVSSISLSDQTVRTRFIGWNAAWQGFKEDPFFGIGMENFNIVFNKYFPAEYYNLAPTETYFDRAHNQFFNILAESGIFAFILYLFFPLFIAYYLIKGYREEKIDLSYFLIFSAVSIAYFIHVFFVFDDINSFLFFAVLIAFIEFKYNQGNLIISKEGEAKPAVAVKAAGAVLILLAVFSIYNYNLKNLLAARYAAYGYMSSHLDETVAYYNRALDLNIAPAANITINYVDYLTGLGDKIDQIHANKTMAEIVGAAIKRVKEEMEKEIAKNSNDAFFYMKMGKLNNLEYLFYDDKKYIDEALTNFSRAVELSPERLQDYYFKGESYILIEENDKAVEVLEKALALNPDFRDSYYYLGRAYLAQGETEKAYDYIVNKAIRERNYLPQNNNFLLTLSQVYLEKQKNYQKAVDIYEAILTYDTENSDIMAALSAGYLQLGDKEKAIAMARKSAETNPELVPGARLFIEKIESGDYQDLLE